MRDKNMPGDVEAREIPKDVQGRLLAYPNVLGVGFGEKETDEGMTGEPSVLVFVSEKVDERELHEDDVIPDEVEFGGERYRTDVVESGVVDAL
jgi:hypothetical protein